MAVAPARARADYDILLSFSSSVTAVIAATVAIDPDKYSEAFLGKTNEEYCTWILNPEKWGEFPDGLQAVHTNLGNKDLMDAQNMKALLSVIVLTVRTQKAVSILFRDFV